MMESAMSALASKKTISKANAVVATEPAWRARGAAVHRSERKAHARVRSRAFEYLLRATADSLALCVAVALAGVASWIINTQFLGEGYFAFGAANLQHRLGVWAILFVGLCSWFS